MTPTNSDVAAAVESLLAELAAVGAPVPLPHLVSRWGGRGMPAQSLFDGLSSLVARGRVRLNPEDASVSLQPSGAAALAQLSLGEVAMLSSEIAAGNAAPAPREARPAPRGHVPAVGLAPLSPGDAPGGLRLLDEELLRQRQESLSLHERPWHVLYGCRPVSDGCRYCHAHERLERYFQNSGRPLDAGRRHQPLPVAAALAEPAQWSSPQRVVVAPLSDLFQPGVPAVFVDSVIGVIAAQPQHFFQVTTRHPARMRDLLGRRRLPPNLSVGVAAEDGAAYEDRVPYLFDLAAAWRHVVLEPLLGPVEVERIELPTHDILWPLEGLVQQYLGLDQQGQPHWLPKSDPLRRSDGIHWMVLGGERGQSPRPPHPAWVRAVRDACRRQRVPFFFRGWGDCVPTRKPDLDDPRLVIVSPDGVRRGRGAGSAINRVFAGKDDVFFTRLARGDEPIQFYLDGQRCNQMPNFDARLPKQRMVDLSPLARELDRLSEGGAPSGPTTGEYIRAQAEKGSE